MGLGAETLYLKATSSNVLTFFRGFDLAPDFIWEYAGLRIQDEPNIALSVPTWTEHFFGVFEWVYAMDCVWWYAQRTNNSSWKWLTWAMVPVTTR